MKGEVRARIIAAIAKTRLWADQLTRGEAADIATIAKREGRTARSIRMTLSLAFLAPEIVEAAARGTLPPGDVTTARRQRPGLPAEIRAGGSHDKHRTACWKY